MAQGKITPEGQLVSHPKWGGNAITNDALIIEKKGIKSPKRNDMYAVARSKNNRSEVWFRTEEKLKSFLEKNHDVIFNISIL